MYPVETSVTDTDESGRERVYLPVFFSGGGICTQATENAFFRKRSSRSVDIFVKLGYRFRVLVGGRK